MTESKGGKAGDVSPAQTAPTCTAARNAHWQRAPLYRRMQKELPMQLFSWLSQRMNNRQQPQRAPERKPNTRFRPTLEALEDRWVPSTLTVTNNLDSGAGSLRAEIAA